LKGKSSVNEVTFIEEVDALCKLKVDLLPSCPELVMENSNESDEIEKLPNNLKLRSVASHKSDKETVKTKDSRKGSIQEI
jgi:hypothetical protein